MSDKQIKIPVSVDTIQAKKDLDSLLTSAKQPLLVPIKTDTTESLKNIKDVQSEFKLLQNQFQNLKVSGDLKGLNEVQNRLEFLATSIKTIPKLDIKSQIDSQNIDNGINKIRTDINSLVNTAKQPIQIGLKTDSTEAIKSVKDIQNEFKLLQSQFQLLKINGDTSGFNSIKSQVQDLSNKLKDIPKLDIKGQIQSQNIDNGLAKIKKEVKDIQSGKIDIQAYLTGSFKNDIASIKNSVNSIPRAITVGIALAGAQAALNLIGQIASSLASLGGNTIGNFLSEGFDYTKGIENSTSALTLSLQNSAKATNEANQRFNEGKGTMEDYATITGKTTESLYETEKASHGAGGASKAYKIDLSELKGELLNLKQETQIYNRDLKDQESAKKDLENATKDLVKSYNREIDSIQDTIKSLNDQEKAALVRANSTDKEIKDLERLIEIKQRHINLDEQKLNKDLSKQTKGFDRQNQNNLDQIGKKELALEKQSLEIQKRKNILDNNPTANAGALAQIKNEEEAIRSQTDELRLQKNEISLKRKELVSNIEIQQQSQRDLIDNRKEELEKNKEIADAKKAQNEEIKDQFQGQIDQQKNLIDSLKEKIEKANIKLDLDTAPIKAKIDDIKDQIQNLQDKSQEVQNQISDKQQAQSEIAASSGGGGGGGGKKISVPLVDIDAINAEKKGKSFDEISDGDVKKRIDRVIGESTAFALKTPFEKKDVISISAQLEALKFNTLAGVEDKEKGIKGSKDIFGAGYNNILNVASDFIARKLQTDGGGSSQEAVKDFTRAITYLKSGNTKSFTQFGVTGDQLLNTGKSFGFDLKKQKDLAKLSTEQITQILGKVGEKALIKGSAAAQSETTDGILSNAKDAFNGLYESLFGDPKNPKSLIGSIKEAVGNFTDILSGPDSSELKKSFKELGTSLGTLLKQLITPENLKATFDNLKSVVDGMKSYLTPDNIKSFSSAIGDFVKGIPNTLKTFGDVIEKIAATLGIKTEKVKSQETKDFFNKKEKQGLFDINGYPIIDDGGGERTKADKVKETIKTFEENKAKKDKGQIVLGGPSEEDYKKAQEALKTNLAQQNKDTDEKRKEDLANLKQNEEDKRNAILETQRIIRAEIIKTVQESKINFDTMAIDSQNGFITLTNGAKVQLSEIGATSKNTTDEITLKFNQVKESLVQSFTDGRILSEPQIKLLAETSGKTIDEIKLKNEEIKTSLQEKFKTGKELSAIELQELAKLNNSTVETITKKHKEIILEEKFKSGKELSDVQLKELAKIHGTTVEEIKNKQKEIVENSSQVASGINSEFGKVNLQKAKDEFLGFGSLFAGIQREANNLLGTIKELAKNKDGTQTNNIGQAIGNIANNFGKEIGIVKKATGGLITGGSGVRDDVPLMAMGGEFVLTKNAVNKYGLNILNEINQGKIDLNTPKIESIRIPTAPSPRVSNAYNNQNNQKSQSITNVNNINVPNSGNFEHNLKNSLMLYADKLNLSLNSGFSNIAI